MSGTNSNDQMPRSVFEDLADVGQYCRGDALPNCDHVGDAIDNLCAGGVGGARGATEPAYEGSVVMEQSTRNADDRSSATGVNAAAVAAAGVGVGVGVAAGYAVTRRGQSTESTHAPAPVEEVPPTEPEQLARSASVQSRAEQSTSVQSTASAETSGATSFASRISAMSAAAAAAIGLDYPMELAPNPTIETEPPAEEEAAFVGGGDLNKLTDPEDGGGLEDVEFKKDDARDDAATVDSSEGGMLVDAPLQRKKKKRFAALGPLGIAALAALLAGAGLAIGLSVGRGDDQASAMAVPEPVDPCEEVPSMMGSKSSKSEKEMSSRRTEEVTMKEEAFLAVSGRWQRRALQRVMDKTVTEEGIDANGEKTGWIRRGGRRLEGHLATATKSSKTSKASTDDGCSKSSKGTKSTKSSKSAGTPSAVPSLEPSASSAPSLEPSTSSAPSTSAMPSASSAPSLQPSLSPTASSPPSTSASPSTSAKPSVSSAPSLEPSLSPTASSAPSTSASPSASSKPSVSSEPSVSAEPSTSASPSASAEPSASSKPSVSAKPSASSKPSSSSAPSFRSSEPSLEPSVSSVPSYSGRPTFLGGDKCQIFEAAMEPPFSTCSVDKVCCNKGNAGNMFLDCRSGCAPCQMGVSSNECCVDIDIPCGTGANADKPICCKIQEGNKFQFECKATAEDCPDMDADTVVEPVVEEGMACGDIFCPAGTSCVYIPVLVPGMGEAHYDCLSD